MEVTQMTRITKEKVTQTKTVKDERVSIVIYNKGSTRRQKVQVSLPKKDSNRSISARRGCKNNAKKIKKKGLNPGLNRRPLTSSWSDELINPKARIIPLDH
jgi:hypothetical protein